ncbi:MAG: hypothetical protein H0Z38_01405 [Firmicutes bacterium]|nr:hypothetical protein [Bacillota bacterium]
MSAREKVAYLRGLIEGSDFTGGDEKARSVWTAVLDVLEELTEDVEALDMDQAELENYVDAIDDDLSYLEDVFYDDEEEDEATVEIECPECGEIVCFDEDLLYEDDVEVTCYNCGAVVYTTDDEEYVEDEESDTEE